MLGRWHRLTLAFSGLIDLDAASWAASKYSTGWRDQRKAEGGRDEPHPLHGQAALAIAAQLSQHVPVHASAASLRTSRI